MPPRQCSKVEHLLIDTRTIHLGDCHGADFEAWLIAGLLGVWRIGHPASGVRRAHLAYDEERREKPPLERNKDIVKDGVDGLIAAPRESSEKLRSGTWATVRYARKLGRRIWIVRPDGTVVEEPAR